MNGHGGPIGNTPMKPHVRHSTIVLRGFEESLNWASIIFYSALEAKDTKSPWGEVIGMGTRARKLSERLASGGIMGENYESPPP